jgi:hypothetical protein
MKPVYYILIVLWVSSGVSGNIYRTIYHHNFDWQEWIIGDVIFGVLGGPWAWIYELMGW